MVEGRISAGVVVGADSDIGGGASIMGTLSGGGTEVISIGSGCLLGANAGIGISLGDGCVVEAGCYVTGGSRVTLPDGSVVKARELSGRDGLLFRRNSVSGALEALPRDGNWGALNAELHANTSHSRRLAALPSPFVGLHRVGGPPGPLARSAEVGRGLGGDVEVLEQRDGELLRPLHVRRVPDVGQHDLAVGAAGRGVAVQHRRVWVTIGCGGHASSPGQPGTAPTEPRNARSNTDVSETIWSASPRIHSTGGFSGRSTMPETSNTVGAIVLSTPRAPGATPGQASTVTASPG